MASTDAAGVCGTLRRVHRLCVRGSLADAHQAAVPDGRADRITRDAFMMRLGGEFGTPGAASVPYPRNLPNRSR